MNKNIPASRWRTCIAIVAAFLPGLLGWMSWKYSDAKYQAAAKACKAESTADSVPREVEFKHREELGNMMDRRMNSQLNIVFDGSIVASLVIGVLGAKGKYWLGAFIGLIAIMSYMLSADPIGGVIAIPLSIPTFIGLIWLSHTIAHGIHGLWAKT